jgi:hypothetical protein
MLLGFLTHQVAAVYLAALLVHFAVLAWRDRAFRLPARQVVALLALGGLVVGPWYGFLVGQFGLTTVFRGTPVTLMDPHGSSGPRYLVGSMLHNVYTSVVPIELLGNLLGGAGGFPEWYKGVTALYFSLLAGALTWGLKDANHLVFLNDWIGNGSLLFLVTAVAVQLALVVLLIRWTRNPCPTPLPAARAGRATPATGA